MVQESAVERQCICGRIAGRHDIFYVEDYDVIHVICYECGHEWVE